MLGAEVDGNYVKTIVSAQKRLGESIGSVCG